MIIDMILQISCFLQQKQFLFVAGSGKDICYLLAKLILMLLPMESSSSKS